MNEQEIKKEIKTQIEENLNSQIEENLKSILIPNPSETSTNSQNPQIKNKNECCYFIKIKFWSVN